MDIEDLIRDAITEGVIRAIWQIATNATDAPCEDFYAAIERGVADATYRAMTETTGDDNG